MTKAYVIFDRDMHRVVAVFDSRQLAEDFVNEGTNAFHIGEYDVNPTNSRVRKFYGFDLPDLEGDESRYVHDVLVGDQEVDVDVDGGVVHVAVTSNDFHEATDLVKQSTVDKNYVVVGKVHSVFKSEDVKHNSRLDKTLKESVSEGYYYE